MDERRVPFSCISCSSFSCGRDFPAPLHENEEHHIEKKICNLICNVYENSFYIFFEKVLYDPYLNGS